MAKPKKATAKNKLAAKPNAQVKQLANKAMQKIKEAQKALQKLAKENPLLAAAATAVGVAVLKKIATKSKAKKKR